MDTNQLYALIEAAEVQQKAVDAAVAQLKLEREALARERKALAREVREAVDGAVTGAMSDASATASRVVGQALDPAAARLSSLISRADGASQRLEGAASGLRWKWVTMLAAGTVCTVLQLARGRDRLAAGRSGATQGECGGLREASGKGRSSAVRRGGGKEAPVRACGQAVRLRCGRGLLRDSRVLKGRTEEWGAVGT